MVNGQVFSISDRFSKHCNPTGQAHHDRQQVNWPGRLCESTPTCTSSRIESGQPTPQKIFRRTGIEPVNTISRASKGNHAVVWVEPCVGEMDLFVLAIINAWNLYLACDDRNLGTLVSVQFNLVVHSFVCLLVACSPCQHFLLHLRYSQTVPTQRRDENSFTARQLHWPVVCFFVLETISIPHPASSPTIPPSK